MKRWYHRPLLGAVFVVVLIIVTELLRFTVRSGQDNIVLVASLHNLYYVPILLAAMVFGETGCVVIALLATVASGMADAGLHLPAGMTAWWSIAVRGAFFLSLGYLAARIAERSRAHTRSWQSLLEISQAINGSLDLEETLHTITQKSVELTSADASAIRLLSDDGQEMVYADSCGLSEKYKTKGPMLVADNAFLQRLLHEGKIYTHDVRKSIELQYRDEILEEGIVSILSIPLKIGDKVTGLLNLYRKRSLTFPGRDRRIAYAFAEQVALAIQNARLYASIQRNYLETVRAFTRAIEAKDAATHGHSEHVAQYAVKLGAALGLSAAELQTLEFGALLHDLGKISLDDRTLFKKGTLTVDEQVMLEMHPMIGKSILEPVEFLRPAMPIVLYHHEHWDGTGYPTGIAGEEIPLLARIVAVANGLDHLMYHASPFPLQEAIALEELNAQAGTRYDPALVASLASVLAAQSSTVEADEPVA